MHIMHKKSPPRDTDTNKRENTTSQRILQQLQLIFTHAANLLIPVGPILSIPFDAFFYISLHYIPSHKLFTSPLGKQLSINLEGK